MGMRVRTPLPRGRRPSPCTATCRCWRRSADRSASRPWFRNGPNVILRLSAHLRPQRDHAVGHLCRRLLERDGDFSQSRDASGGNRSRSSIRVTGRALSRQRHPARRSSARRRGRCIDLLPAAERCDPAARYNFQTPLARRHRAGRDPGAPHAGAVNGPQSDRSATCPISARRSDVDQSCSVSPTRATAVGSSMRRSTGRVASSQFFVAARCATSTRESGNDMTPLFCGPHERVGRGRHQPATIRPRRTGGRPR